MSHSHSSDSELAVVYASLILQDDEIEITADKLETLVHTAGVKGVDQFWYGLFARALDGADMKSLLSSVGSATAGAAGPAVAAAATEAAPEGKAEAKKEAKKEESSDEDVDMGFGMFD